MMRFPVTILLIVCLLLFVDVSFARCRSCCKNGRCSRRSWKCNTCKWCKNCYDSNCPSNHVCTTRCNGRCVECKESSDCDWRTDGKTQCVANRCVECTTDSNCQSDSECNMTCNKLFGQCTPRIDTIGNLNCVNDTSILTNFGKWNRCLVGQSKCVECLTNGDCAKNYEKNGNKSFCDVTTHTCETCLHNNDCRTEKHCGNNIYCNATAGIGENYCYLVSNYTTTDGKQNITTTGINDIKVITNIPVPNEYSCDKNQICYPYEGVCEQKCNNDTHCTMMNNLSLYPNRNVCHNGMCIGCSSHEYCDHLNIKTCGRECIWFEDEANYKCFGGQVCPDAFQFEYNTAVTNKASCDISFRHLWDENGVSYGVQKEYLCNFGNKNRFSYLAVLSLMLITVLLF